MWLPADSWNGKFQGVGGGGFAGGVGLNTFDVVSGLDQWVEGKTKPAQMIASHATNGVVDRTRPLCPYPQVATYKERGASTLKAAHA